VSPLVGGYNQWIAGHASGPGLPRPLLDFLAGAFGPLSPIVPMPIDQPQGESGRPIPRRWQYPVGWNLPVGQPGSEGIKLASFAALRAWADTYSVVRAMLNIRINELAGFNWDVGQTGDAQSLTKGDKGAVKDARQRAAQIVAWFRRIDSNYKGFQSWFTAILEDQYVIDAPSIFVAPTRVLGKGLFGSDVSELQAINGETIRPLVDLRGATPRPPAPAYQQYLWGVPRSDLLDVMTEADLDTMSDDLASAGVSLKNDPEEEYRADQLLYLPRWRRTWTPYGFSPIEQAILPISIGMRRQQFLLDYFTEGSIPGVYVIAGDAYVTPGQQKQLQDTLNALAGDQAYKHRVIVLPPGSKTDPQKDMAWQSQVDQTIVEQVAMILHIQPHEIGMVPGGRTSGLGGSGMAQQQQSSATEERTEPDRKWWKESFFDWVIQRLFGQDDLEWKWVDFDSEGKDEDKQRAADIADVTNGIRSIDEVRVDRGFDPWDLPLTQSPYTVQPVTPLDPSVQPPTPPAPAAAPGAPGGPGGLDIGALIGTPKPGKGPKGGKGKGKNPFAKAPGTGQGQTGTAPAKTSGPVPSSEPKPGEATKITVASLVKGKIRYKGNLTNVVYRYLLRSYPEEAVEWVKAKGGDWEFDPHVDLTDINMARRPGGRDPEKVEAISGTLDTGASMDPVVLVERPQSGDYKYDIADGWHRILGAEKAGWKDVPAFIGSGFDDTTDWGLQMQDVSDSKKRAAAAELATLRRYLRKGGDLSAFKAAAIDRDTMRLLEGEYEALGREAALERARLRIAKQTGNPQGLIDWYNAGADGQIDWGEDGDWQQCVDVASGYMTDDQAQGFCQLRHMDATGETTSEHAAEDRGSEKTISLAAPIATGLVPYDLAGQEKSPCGTCGKVHDGPCDGTPSAEMLSGLVKMIDAELHRRGVADIRARSDGAMVATYSPLAMADLPKVRQRAQYGWAHVPEGTTTKKGDGATVAGVVRDGKRYGVSVARDSKGVFIHTHRARSASYPDLDSIPTEDLARIDSSG
jgi:Phage portal protein/ParB-like nuclease domain